jgi:hypothetical protein
VSFPEYRSTDLCRTPASNDCRIVGDHLDWQETNVATFQSLIEEVLISFSRVAKDLRDFRTLLD